MLLNSLIHNITEYILVYTTLVLLCHLSILDGFATNVQNYRFLLRYMSFMDDPLTIDIEELVDRVLVWRAGSQNSHAHEYVTVSCIETNLCDIIKVSIVYLSNFYDMGILIFTSWYTKLSTST